MNIKDVCEQDEIGKWQQKGRCTQTAVDWCGNAKVFKKNERTIQSADKRYSLHSLLQIVTRKNYGKCKYNGCGQAPMVS